MKRSGNLFSFFFFGIVSQWVLLVLLGQTSSVVLFYNFLFSGVVFFVIRALIEKKERETVVVREIRKYVARRGSAFRLAFGVVGSYCLLLTNTNLNIDFEKLVFYGFFSVILTETIFEAARESWNYFQMKKHGVISNATKLNGKLANSVNSKVSFLHSIHSDNSKFSFDD